MTLLDEELHDSSARETGDIDDAGSSDFAGNEDVRSGSDEHGEEGETLSSSEDGSGKPAKDRNEDLVGEEEIIDDEFIEGGDDGDDIYAEESSKEEDQEGETGEREIVIPGQVIGTRDESTQAGFGATVDNGGNIISLYVGFLQRRGKYLNVVPFKGHYLPRVGDKVIGKIIDKNVVLYKLDINSPYIGILRASDDMEESGRPYGGRGRRDDRSRRGPPRKDTTHYNEGDLVIAKVLKFDRTTEPTLTTIGPDLGPLKGGFITEIAVPKIPRLIGKHGSMIKLLNKLTGCRIFVAQNGVVWFKGKNPKNERVLLKVIHMIENEAHTFGLTDRVKEFIENQL